MLVLLLLLVGTATEASPSREQCPAIMEDAGVTDMFAPMVAHSIHSLTVEDIRYFFKQDVTENNNIPTVNMDLRSDTRILPNAPLAGYDEDFSTQSMKTFDLVMRNMNRTWWGITNYQTLDMLTHAFHMAEIWDKAAEQYKMVARLLDPESDICSCVTDIESNNVLNYLNLLAFKIKYPGITSGNKTITDHYLNKERVKRSLNEEEDLGYALGYRLGFQRSNPNFEGFDFNLSDVELLKDIAEKLVDEDTVTPVHAGEDWQVWRDMVKHGMDQSGYYDLAVFMFCMLN